MIGGMRQMSYCRALGHTLKLPLTFLHSRFFAILRFLCALGF